MRTSLTSEGRRPRALRLTVLTLLVAACSAPMGDPGSTSPGASGTPGATAASVPVSESLAPTASARPSATPAPTGTPTTSPYSRVGLVVRYLPACDVCPDGLITGGSVILDDGRVIWRSGSGLTVRSLTPVGLEHVRGQLAIKALEASATYRATLKPGATPPPAHGFGVHRFELERDGTRISVSADDAAAFAEESPGVYDVPREAVVLSELGTTMQDLGTWIASSDWASAASAYVPDRYLVIIGRDPTRAPGVDVEQIAWPFGAIDQAGSEFRYRPDQPLVTDSRCLVVSAETAKAMATAETAAGAPPRELGDMHSANTYAWSRGGGSITVMTEVLLPYQSADCSDAMAW